MDTRTLEAVFRVEAMAEDISEIKGAMRDLAAAVNKLAVVEERQAQDRTDISRVFATLVITDARLKALEIAQPVQRMTSGWVQSAVWIVVGAVISALLSQVLLSAPAQKAAAGASVSAK